MIFGGLYDLFKDKKIWFEKILSGEKKIEFREYKEFYITRFKKPVNEVLFVCEKQTAKYRIIKIEIVNESVLGTMKQFAIHLGDRIS